MQSNTKAKRKTSSTASHGAYKKHKTRLYRVSTKEEPNGQENHVIRELVAPICAPLQIHAKYINTTTNKAPEFDIHEYLDFLETLLDDGQKELLTSWSRFEKEMRRAEDRYNYILCKLTQINVKQVLEI